MNSRFIKVLIIINGILIPIFILTLLGILITDYFKDRTDKSDTVSTDRDMEIALEYSSPQKITNSENYYVSKFKVEKYHGITQETEIEIGNVPENTVNIFFLNEGFEKIGSLLETDASIKHINIPNQFSNYEEQRKLTKNITYLIAFEDSNDNGEIDKYDEHYLCISDLSGNNFNKIIDKKIKEYKFINNFSKILITYFENEKDLAVGVYDIENKEFEKKTILNFEN